MSLITWSDVKDTAQSILIESTSDYGLINELVDYYEWEWIELKWIQWKALEWIKETWEILSAKGLTSYETETEYCEVLIAFIALVGFYIESCGFAGKWDLEEVCLEWAEELEINLYHVRQLTWVIFASNWDTNKDSNEDADKLDRSQFWYLVNDARKQVIAILIEKFGSRATLSSSIWQSIQPELDKYDEDEEWDEEYKFFRAETEIINSIRLSEEMTSLVDKHEEEKENSKEIYLYETDTETLSNTIFIDNIKKFNKNNEVATAIDQMTWFFQGEVIFFKEKEVENQTCFQKQTKFALESKSKYILSEHTNNLGFNEALKMENNGISKCPFTTRTFEILSELLNDSCLEYTFYQAYIELKEEVEAPFQKLCSQVATQLAEQLAERLESKQGVFNGIMCWDSEDNEDEDLFFEDTKEANLLNFDYSFYFKKISIYDKTQLFIQLNENLLKFGFYVNKNSIDSQNLFNKNFQKYQKELSFIVRYCLDNNNTVYSYSLGNDQSEFTWKDWLKDSIQEVYVAVHLATHEVLQKSSEELSHQIAQTFERFFPIVLLATSDNPMPVIREFLNLPKYTLEECAEDTSIKKSHLKQWIRAIERKGQAILFGSPGTGKTFIAEHLARHLTNDNDDCWELVQFHPAYSYEDFIQGIRPQSQDGELKYPLVPGRFLEFCKKAKSCQNLCVLIIDEINRANLTQVFGELMYLLEYRDKKIRLAGNSELFSIPKNVRIIGTMNTADRSIALVDHALRRRFAFIELRPNYEVLRRYHEKKETGFQVDGLIETLKRLNKAIANKHYEIGISYFLTENLAEELEDIWQMEIEPYLEEYFYDQLDKVDEFRWDKIKQQVRS